MIYLQFIELYLQTLVKSCLNVQGKVWEPKQRKEALPNLDISDLHPDQQRAYEIVAWHLQQRLGGYLSPNYLYTFHWLISKYFLLCSLEWASTSMHGSSWGRWQWSQEWSKLLQMFETQAASSQLLKSAYTGIAASLIDGKTLCNIGNISVDQSAA